MVEWRIKENNMELSKQIIIVFITCLIVYCAGCHHSRENRLIPNDWSKNFKQEDTDGHNNHAFTTVKARKVFLPRFDSRPYLQPADTPPPQAHSPFSQPVLSYFHTRFNSDNHEIAFSSYKVLGLAKLGRGCWRRRIGKSRCCHPPTLTLLLSLTSEHTYCLQTDCCNLAHFNPLKTKRICFI
jgi:hypothetical protein